MRNVTMSEGMRFVSSDLSLVRVQQSCCPLQVLLLKISGTNFLGSQGQVWQPRFLYFLAWDSRSERISPLHGEARLADLCRIRRGYAGELRPNVVNDVKIAVGAIVVPKTDIGADSLGIRRVHLMRLVKVKKGLKE